MNQKVLTKVAKGLLKLNAVEHKRPKEPTKAELNKKFVMRLDRKGNPAIKEGRLFCQVKGIIPYFININLFSLLKESL